MVCSYHLSRCHTHRLLTISVFALQHKGKKKTGHAVHNMITPEQPGYINSLAQTARERKKQDIDGAYIMLLESYHFQSCCHVVT
jgi:hypothetical protein